MKKTRSYKKLSQRSEAFLGIREVADLAQLLGVMQHTLSLSALSPRYHIFPIPKKGGSQRWIEIPGKTLKKIQGTLGLYLQAAYLFHRTDAAYGFLVNSKRDPSPRHILSNAQRHLGHDWLYNADFEAFFHSIKSEDIFRLFRGQPFHFSHELADMLTRLCTHQGRLPMGTATSPILSNWACVALDLDLQSLAQRQRWVYTRYADDLCFSSDVEITTGQMEEINRYCGIYGFRFNPAKVWLYGPKDEKTITGLLLRDGRVDVPGSFIQDIRKDIQQLSNTYALALRFGGRPPKWLRKLEQAIDGKINFVTQIKGERHDLPKQLNRQLDEARHPDEAFIAASWTDFPYG